MVEWESILERDAILHFEFSPGIITYQEQPELITYIYQEQTKRYFPDFLLILRNRNLFHVEIKPLSKLRSPNLISKFEAIIERYETHPAKFRLLTDQYLRFEPRLANLKLLATAQRCNEDLNKARELCKELLDKDSPIVVSRLVNSIGLKQTLSLLACGEIMCDLNLALDSDSNFVRFVEGIDHDALLI